jgi:hypothetical protein
MNLGALSGSYFFAYICGMSKMRTGRMQPGPGPKTQKPASDYKPFASFKPKPKPKPTNVDMRKGMKSNSDGLMDFLNVPQKLMTKQVTGKYEGPGDALERKGIVGATGRDVVNFVADPINAIPLAKLGKGMKMSKADAKAIKYNKSVKKVKTASNATQIAESKMKRNK